MSDVAPYETVADKIERRLLERVRELCEAKGGSLRSRQVESLIRAIAEMVDEMRTGV